ncbi:unnamed protein product, partial [Prorocentrum cordatum]
VATSSTLSARPRCSPCLRSISRLAASGCRQVRRATFKGYVLRYRAIPSPSAARRSSSTTPSRTGCRRRRTRGSARRSCCPSSSASPPSCMRSSRISRPRSSRRRARPPMPTRSWGKQAVLNLLILLLFLWRSYLSWASIRRSWTPSRASQKPTTKPNMKRRSERTSTWTGSSTTSRVASGWTSWSPVK